jgi:ribose transport system substrate-binding protein/inositol transport system substrate-binding protein
MKNKFVLCIITTITVLMTAAAFTGCNRNDKASSAAEKQPVIALCISHMSNAFTKSVADSMTASAKAAGADIIVYEASNDVSKQISQIESAVNQKVDFICVEPVSMAGVTPAMEVAKNAGIPVISSFQMVNDTSKVTSYVVVTNQALGRVEMQRAVDDIGGRGSVAILLGPRGSEAEINRSLGYKEVLDKYPDVKVVFEETGNWTTEEGMRLAENWLQTGTKIDAFVSQNDTMALGAVKAVEDRGLSGQIKVYGIDAVPDAIKAVKEGRLTMSVSQEIPSVSQKIVDLCMALYRGETINNAYELDGKVVDSTNVDSYL